MGGQCLVGDYVAFLPLELAALAWLLVFAAFAVKVRSARVAARAGTTASGVVLFPATGVAVVAMLVAC